MSSDTRGTWTRYFDASGKAYYHDSATNATTWDEPAAFRAPVLAAVPAWEEFVTAEGKRYYHHRTTQVTQWDPPSEPFVPAELPGAVVAADPTLAAPMGVVGASPAAADVDLEREIFGDAVPRDPQEAQQLNFKKMLLELRLPEGITWTETLEQFKPQLGSDPRFAAVPAHKRPAMFGELQIARKAALIRREEKERKEAEAAFLAELEKHADQVGLGLSYDNAEKMFGQFEWWRRVAADRRVEVYENWEWNQQRVVLAEQEKAVREACEQLKEELRSAVKTETFTFAQFNTLFEKSKAYEVLPRKNRIEIFSAHIRQLEEVAARNETEEKKHKHWGSMMQREALHARLRQLAASGAITYASHWPEVRDRHLMDPATGKATELLAGMVDANYVGSSVRDLTEAFLETLKPEYDEWKTAAPRGIGTVVAISFPQFLEHLQSSEAWPVLQKKAHFCRALYEERQAEIELERKRAKFRELLDDKVRRDYRDWAKVRSKIDHRSAYKALPEEECRRTWEVWCRAPAPSELVSRGSSSGKRERGDSDEPGAVKEPKMS